MHDYTTLARTLVAVVAAITGNYAASAESSFGFPDGNGGIRGYDATFTTFPTTTTTATNVHALSEPLPSPREQGSVGSPAVVAIVVGCVAVVAVALTVAIRLKARALEPTTPLDDEAEADAGVASSSTVSCTKSTSAAQYQQPFDGPQTPPRLSLPLVAAASQLWHGQRHFAPHTCQPLDVSRRRENRHQPVDVVVVAM